MPLLPVPIVAELAPGANPNADPAEWEWTSDGVRWRTKAGLTITAGRDDEDSQVPAGSATATFDDRDGNLSPRNVFGRWYGELDKNTPIRYVLDLVSDPFTRTRASGWGPEPQTGKTWLHSNTSAWSVNGTSGRLSLPTSNTAAYAILGGATGPDVDITHVSSVDTMPVGGAWVDATVVRRVDNSNLYRLHTEFQTDGTIRVKIVRVLNGVGTDLLPLTITGVTFTAGQRIATHVRAIGATLLIRCWRVDSEPEPTVWHGRASDSQVAGRTAGLYEWRLATSGAAAASFDNFTVRVNLFAGMVPEWPVRWPDKSGADSTVPVTASGMLRWLEQRARPTRSAIDLQLSGQLGAAYWRLEDGEGAKSGGAATPRTGVATIADGTFGNEDAPAGALSSVVLNTAGTSKLTGNVSTWPYAQNGYQALVYMRFPTLPPASPAVPVLEIRAVGRVTRWVVTADAATFNLSGYDADGDLVSSTGGIFYGQMNPTRWFSFQMRAAESGSSVNYQMYWHQVGSTDFWGMTGTYTGSADRASGATVIAAVDNMAVSHLWLGSRDAAILTNAFMLTSAGYAGETASARIARVFRDAGIQVFVHAGDSVRLGPQPRAGTALDIARDAEQADLGTLYERGPVYAYLPRGARMNPDVALALDWSLGHLAEPPEPEDDDLDLINSYEAKRPGGSSRTEDDPASIAKFREYADSGEHNVEVDDQLADVAGIKVAEGTTNALRWPRLTIDLVAHPELIPAWLGCRVGSRITVANPPEQIRGEVIDLVLLGYTQTINKHQWRVEMTCAPVRPWNEFAVWGETAPDAEASELVAQVGPTATSVQVRSRWSSDTWATEGGYAWVIDGEQPITVNSVTAPVLSGGYFVQTASVTRSPTLAKTLRAGKPVHLATPGRWGSGV